MVDRKVQVVTSPFGQRKDGFHRGIDLRTWDIKFWKPLDILFPETCEVLRLWTDDWGGGMAVKPLDSQPLFDELKFIHIDVRPSITVKDVFSKGTLIGRSMLSKLNKSHHLHFEVWQGGRAIDPVKYLSFRGINYE